MNTSRDMTAEDLTAAGRYLYGDNWRTPMAHDLRVTAQAVYAWARPASHKDARRIPGPATKAVELMVHAKQGATAESVEDLF